MSALACFHAGSLILVELEFGMLVFMEGGKPENPETWKKTLGARREPTTNSTHIWQLAGIEDESH